MSVARLQNSILSGAVAAVPSKSDAHRALICAFLAGGGEVKGVSSSEDITATENALKALKNGDGVINCRESGSTLRFIIPVAAALGKSVTFTGEGRLGERPLVEYLRLLPEHGVKCEYGGALPLKISGKLKSGRYELSGGVSSQFITGLLFALPLLSGDSEIILSSPLESKPYADMTVKTLERFSVSIEERERGYYIKGNQEYKKSPYTVEGDWSQAAFFLAGGALTGGVSVTGLDINSAQGDKEIAELLCRFGADVEISDSAVTVRKSVLNGIDIDVRDIPDLMPILAVLGAFAKGKTVITGGERLRLKESDRIKSVAENLIKMGIDATETADGIIIEGGAPRGAALSSFNDHRIVMAFAVAAAAARGGSVIEGAQSVNKSYPDFFKAYNSLGGKADVISNGRQG